ncbi:MAG: hypothetical protein P1V20_07820 [Verrucomicrobiales bacterium]|nr:hypothetical protein [Verrucomicrobiales bacterium]
MMSVFDQLFGDLSIENRKNLLALFVVVKFFVVIGFVSFLVLSIRRNASKRCAAASDLLDELEEEDKPVARDTKPSGSESSWERNPDWWKE